MDEYISKTKFKESLAKLTAEGGTETTRAVIMRTLSKVVPQLIDDEPSADVQPMKHGKWCGYLCSECNEYADYFISGDFYFDEKPNFCPRCGARMDGDTK